MRRIIIVIFAAVILTAGFVFIANNMAASLTTAAANAPEIGTAEQPEVGEVDIGAGDMNPNWLRLVQENIRRSEYRITWQERTYIENIPAAYHAPNRAQDLRTYFTADGIHVLQRTDSANSWGLGMSLSGYGLEDQIFPVASAELVAQQNRIEYQRGALTEWYLNDENGVEQGFTLTRPPLPSWDGENLVLELSLAGDLTPTINEGKSRIFFSNSDGKKVLRYGGLAAYDANGEALPTYMDLVEAGSGSGSILLTVEVNEAEFPITVDPRIEGLTPTYSWKKVSDQENSSYGMSVAGAGDVNGDNYDDVIVGSPTYDNGEEDEGMAFVYLGSSGGLLTTPDWMAEGNQIGANFGIAVNTAGDVNDDTYDDVIVGANWYDSPQEDGGRAFVYHGSGTGLDTTFAWSASGDVEDALFGEAVSTAGDVNNDTYDDVIVGAPGYNVKGKAFVYHGSESGLSTTASWAKVDDNSVSFGLSVGTAGDVNGDLFDDVIVGSLFHSDYAGGVAFVFYGSGTTLNLTADWDFGLTQTLAEYGASVGTAGDINNDGFSDVIVGAPGNDTAVISDTGKVFVYHGSASGLSATEDWSAEGDIASAGLGNSVGTAGDANGDGYADVIIGADAYENIGRVYLYQGASGGLKDTPDWYADGEVSFTGFGVSVGTAGDVNGDTASDVIIGASEYFSGGETIGAAYVYHGTPDLIASNDSPTVLGEETALTATLTILGSYTYEWDLGDGSTSTGITTTHTYPSIGVYTAIVTATSSTLVLTDTTDVTIDEVITGLTASNDSPTVLGESTSFNASVTAGSSVTYEWDFDDGSSGSGANVSHTYAAVGSYTATVTATNSVSSSTTTTSVTVDETIAGLAAANDGPTALGDATSLSASVTAGSSVTYEWDFDDGGTGSGANVSHTYAAVGSYTATVTATNSVSSSTTTTTVTVDETIAGLAAANDGPTALGDATSLSATVTAGSNVTYEWDFDDGSTGSGANVSHTYAAIGSYTATVTATNSVSSSTATTNVIIEDVPIAGLSAQNDGPTTLGETTTLTATITAGTDVTYEWNFGDSNSGSGANTNHVYTAVDTYVATVTASNSVSTETSTTVVTINDAPVEGLAADNDGPTFIGSVTTLSASVTAGSNITYEWDFGDGSPKENGAVVTHVYASAGTYTATVTAKNGVSAPTATTVVIIQNYGNFLPLIFFGQ